MLFVISAPSGAGKTTVIKKLFKKQPQLSFSVSATTREKRKGENDKVDYYFLSKDEFQDLISHGKFIEWEEVFGNYYGTLKSEIEKGIEDRNLLNNSQQSAKRCRRRSLLQWSDRSYATYGVPRSLKAKHHCLCQFISIVVDKR